MNRPQATRPTDPETLKACCAAAYEQDLVALLLGESYHPGGLDLTRHLARTLDLRPGQRVLDVAAGRGATACLLAAEFGVDVDGIDLGPTSVERARLAASERGLDRRVRFHQGDAERLPFNDGTFDAVICECAWCTFPDKATAATEFARVLRPGAQVGITDVTLDRARIDPELATLAGYLACIADARPAAEYAALLEGAGLRVVASEAHDDALTRMIDQIEARLRVWALLDPPGLTLAPETILRYTAAAAAAVADRVAGYQLLVARKPERNRS
jgi:SAM-dependent methyltransferase